MERRKHPRYIKRLETKISIDQTSFWSISGDLSESGLFIRTNRGYNVETPIDIELSLPDNKVSFLKGIVRRTVRTPIPTMRNGMGIEVIAKDETFRDFVKSVSGERKENVGEESAVLCSQISDSSTDQEVNKDSGDKKWDKRQWQRYIANDEEIAVMIGSYDEAKVVDISTGGISFKTEEKT